MPLTDHQIQAFQKKIVDLTDTPSENMSPADLKAYFDSSPEELRLAVNSLIDDLVSTTAGASGAKQIGVETISGLTGNDVQTLLQALKTKVDTKTDKTGDHQGTWRGLTPGQASEAINGGRLDIVEPQLTKNTNKLKTVYSVFDFGAVGDGVTDDTVAFQSAFDTLPHYSILIVGNHRIDGQLTINSRLITLRGYTQSNGNDSAESNTSRLFFKGNFATHLKVNAGSGHSLTLENLTIKGTGNGIGVEIVGGSLVLNNASIQNFNTCVNQTNGYYSKLNNSFIGSCEYGLVFNYCYNINMVGMTIQANTDGIRLLDRSVLRMFGGSIERFYGNGIELGGASVASLFGTYFEGYNAGVSSGTGSCVIMNNGAKLNAIGCQVYLTGTANFVKQNAGTTVSVFSRNNVMAYSTDATAYNTTYNISRTTNSFIDIAGDNWNTGITSANVTYVPFTYANGISANSQFSIVFPFEHPQAKSPINNMGEFSVPRNDIPNTDLDGKLVTAKNDGSTLEADPIGLRATSWGYNPYKTVYQKGQWEKVGIRLPNQVNSTASTISQLVTDFNALLQKLRDNGVMK